MRDITECCRLDLIELIYDATLKSFWMKQGLKRFLRRCHVAETFLSQLSESEIQFRIANVYRKSLRPFLFNSQSAIVRAYMSSR